MLEGIQIMPKAYSIDYREKVLEAYLNKEDTNQGLAKRFKISLSTVKRISQRYRETGKVELYLEQVGRKPKLTAELVEYLKMLLRHQTDITLNEMCQALEKYRGVMVTPQAIHYALKAEKITHKKKSYYASQRDRDDVKKKDNGL